MILARRLLAATGLIIFGLMLSSLFNIFPTVRQLEN